ncbi:carbohydrate ABC transporter permease [Jiangella mangrovi]|uniref:Multiple sugar transport system permease protein n=1 Tax=Jiangella mangrovi TaxID=1524084 RepID=A0A7W9GUD6_9ACTN|nr:sugar ABC transporter permease [Jiangella mangrovi]MBB5790260.1 multiple sugar transport system permease protein [Jiangella mangrovi]
MSRGAKRWLPYALIGAALVVELVVHVVPVLLGIWFAFTGLDRATIGDWTGAPFVGLQNFRTGLDPVGPIGAAFWATLARTALFTIIVVPVAWSIGVVVAWLMATPFRGRGLLRVLFLVPFAVPGFAAAIGWSFMFGRDHGAVNRLLVDDLGVLSDRPFWLIGDHAFWVVAIVWIWNAWPLAYLMSSAAMSAIPADVHDASVLDGASRWRQLWSISRPICRPVDAVVILVLSLGAFNEFGIPFVLFGPRPPESATLLAGLVYGNSFANAEFGVGAAMNLLVATLLVAGVLTYARTAMPRGSGRA